MRSTEKLQEASSLLLVYWALMLLSASLLGWALLIQRGLQVEGQNSREIEARAMARSGIIVALHPLASRRMAFLENEVRPGMRYRVKIVSEGGRLNVNW